MYESRRADQTGPSPIMQYFDYGHLPAALQRVSGVFKELAYWADEGLPAGPEKSTCLRKLLEAKDAAVRAALPLVDRATSEQELERLARAAAGTAPRVVVEE